MRTLKDIKVEQEVWKELNSYKFNKGFKNLSDVIKELLAYKNQIIEQKVIKAIKKVNPKNINVFPIKKTK